MKAQQARTLASYNRWMNERLYAICDELSDEERKKDRGVFFRSIHGTLNHLLLSDKIWLGRFEGEAFAVTRLDQELFEDFRELQSERENTDLRIDNWSAQLTDEILSGDLVYTSIVNPGLRRYVYWVAVTHFFNHQTHHRGQLTAILSQLGKDYGTTDLIWLPEFTTGQY
ncbi:DinB family protein [Synechococcus sp. PCC 6312]|uniref:DinB family protein n=1 Tax=Synechococcus sp. (strain ATCC 27167 / PCC 6312) TaxID=195253 RepID=UPI00029F1741|nr:DinB family protein [Synechococcus sp. PCC 6312]AFY60812.1 hypothetical protein Syn6312_1654 [Synechococcus sp. PCC 6312]